MKTLNLLKIWITSIQSTQGTLQSGSQEKAQAEKGSIGQSGKISQNKDVSLEVMAKIIRCPTFWHLWATREEHSSWDTH